VLGLLDDFFIPISWWRDSAVVDYFHGISVTTTGTGGLPEELRVQQRRRRRVSTADSCRPSSVIASAYTFVVALLLAAAFLRRLRILIPLSAAIFAGLLFTFSRSSLLALAAGLVVLAFVRRRWWPVAAAIATLAVSVAWVHVFPHVAPQGKWTQQDLVQQRNNAKNEPGASSSAGSIDEPSIHSHWISLREGVRTVVHHPQGFGLGRGPDSLTHRHDDQGGSRTTRRSAPRPGCSGAALDRLGLAIFIALVTTAWRTRWWAAAGIAAAFERRSCWPFRRT
jgi:hypothetical protein